MRKSCLMMRDPQVAALEGNLLLKVKPDLKVEQEEEDPVAEAVTDLNLVMYSEGVNVEAEAAIEVAREAVKEAVKEVAKEKV